MKSMSPSVAIQNNGNHRPNQIRKRKSHYHSVCVANLRGEGRIDMFDHLGEAIVAFFVVSVGIAFCVGVLAMYLIPKLWGWIKPIIHMMTA